MERLDITVHDVKAGQFKTDDIGAKMQTLLGDASLAHHSLANEQPLGAACLVSTLQQYSPPAAHCFLSLGLSAIFSVHVYQPGLSFVSTAAAAPSPHFTRQCLVNCVNILFFMLFMCTTSDVSLCTATCRFLFLRKRKKVIV